MSDAVSTRPASPHAEWCIASSADSQAQLFVRAGGPAGRVPLVLVHGFFQPASAILDVPGFSLFQALCAEGHRVYLFDLRGYGRSTRPTFMQQPPEASRPSLGCMNDAVNDLGDIVQFVLKQEGAPRVDLLGYSWGTARSACFTLQAPQQVRRLALYAPVWRPITGAVIDAVDPAAPTLLNPRLGGYAVIRRDDFRRQWDWEIDAVPADRFRSAVALTAAQDALVASDSAGAGNFRAPLGPMVDAFGVHQGGVLFDASALKQPTILLRGAQDRLSTAVDAAALFGALGASVKQSITLPVGTHLLHLEHARAELVRSIAGFLR